MITTDRANVDSSSASYNGIKTFDKQSHKIDYSDLEDIAKLFVKHRMQSTFGIALLHRHHSLPPNHVMVNVASTKGSVICCAEEAGARQIYPASFYLSMENRFLPYEYSTFPAEDPQDSFLSDVASYLQLKSLQKTLAISRISPSTPPSVEHLLPDGDGTITYQLQRELDISGKDGIITLWSFISNDGEISIRPCRACKTDDSGGHTR